MSLITVVQGGQTGVDRGAHEAAIDNGWLVAGYMPRDERDECGQIPPDVAQFLRRHDRPGRAARTEGNVQCSDALLVVVRDAEDPRATPGTARTIDLAAARRLPRMVVDPNWAAALIAEWISRHLARRPLHRQLALLDAEPTRELEAVPARLMIAGPRESKWSGARIETAELLRRVALELIARRS